SPPNYARDNWSARLRELEKQLGKSTTPGSNTSTTAGPPPVTPRAFDPASESNRPGGMPPPTTGEPPITNRPNRPSPGTTDGHIRDYSKSIEKWLPKSMGDSPAMKKLASELGQKDWGKIADSTFGKTGKGPNVNWGKVGDRLSGTGRFFERNAPR